MKAFLLLLIVILAGLVVGEWEYWPARPPVGAGSVSGEAVKAGPQQRLAAANGFHLPPLDDFEEIDQRPLFFEGRRPPAPPPADSDSKKKVKKTLKPSVSLAAIIIIDNERYVLIRDKSSKTGTKRLRAGDDYKGWVVDEIKPDRFILRQGEQNEQILLREFKKVPLPRQTPRAAPKRPAKRVPRKKRPPAPPMTPPSAPPMTPPLRRPEIKAPSPFKLSTH